MDLKSIIFLVVMIICYGILFVVFFRQYKEQKEIDRKFKNYIELMTSIAQEELKHKKNLNKKEK